MTPKESYNKLLAENIIKNLESRNMEGYYAENKAEAVKKALELMSESGSVSWGGSATLNEIGMLDAVYESGKYTILDRAKSDDAHKTMHEALSADYYLMSTNAITYEGELVNVDGNGNRIAALIYGPKNVIVIAGMNKCVENEEMAYSRVRNKAAIMNTLRFGSNTPCTKTGHCHDCKSTDCVCCQLLTTRYSRVKGRTKVILVGEELGF